MLRTIGKQTLVCILLRRVVVISESPEEYKRRIASDIQNALVDQPPKAGAEPEETPADLEVEDDEDVQVPQYVSNLPKEPQPGGPAITAEKKPTESPEADTTEMADEAGAEIPTDIEGEEETAEPAEEKAKSPIRGKLEEKAAQTAGTAVKDYAKKIASKFSSTAIKAAAKAAGTWIVANIGPILIVIIAVILIVVATIFLIRALNGSQGTTPVQAVDVLSDSPLIKTVLALSDKNEFQKNLDQNKAKLVTDIESFKVEINSKYPNDDRTKSTIAKLDEVLKLIADYTSTDAAKSGVIMTKLADAVKPWSVALNPTGIIYPVSGFDAQHKGRGSDYGPFNNNGRPNHRGIDRGMKVGTILRAPADSKIVYLVQDTCLDNVDTGKGNNCNHGFGNTIIGQITAPGSLNGYYWEMHHIKKNSSAAYEIVKGSIVKQGQIVALSGNNGSSSGKHLHFQIDKPEASSHGFPVGEGRMGETIDPYQALGWSR